MGIRIEHRYHKWLRREGFTLLEVMVAALILLVAMAGVVPFFVSALGQSSAVRYKSLATNIAREKMEQIRQLDCRQINGVTDLEERFGTSESARDIGFDVSYGYEESTFDNGLLKKITVTVGWTGPPTGDAASISTMVHQQFVGPRVSRLALSMSFPDPLGTPFRCLYEWTPHTLYIYVAEADWGLVLDNLNQPGMAARDVYARLTLVDSNDQSYPLGDPSNNYELQNLTYSVDASGLVTAVYFPYSFDSGDIPDGYWEFRAVVYNEYNEPGNMWRLRTRVENQAPEAPTGFVAVAQEDNESVLLAWSGGAERDRAYYVLERQKWLGTEWSAWEVVDPELDPNATEYTDVGSAASPLDPWGSDITGNWYQYRIRAVDICNPPSDKWGGYAVAGVAIPSTTTTTLLGETTTTSLLMTTTSATATTAPALSNVMIENKTTKTYNLVIEGDNGTTRTTSVNKKTTLNVNDLPAGNYLITATSSGRPTLKQSFAVPTQAGQIVMTIL